jgi:predicted transcriptional regulator
MLSYYVEAAISAMVHDILDFLEKDNRRIDTLVHFTDKPDGKDMYVNFRSEREAVEIGQALRRASGIVAKSLEDNIREVNRRYDALCARLEVLQGEMSSARLTDSAIQDALQFAQDIRTGIENADYETKRRNLELLQVKVTIEGRKFSVMSLVGAWDGEIRNLPKVGIVDDWHLPARDPL